MTIQEIRTAIEAQQMIQQRNPSTSARWLEASDNLQRLGAMLNEKLREEQSEEISVWTVERKMDEIDLIETIREATGITVPETGDLLESLTDDQVGQVWEHMLGWSKA